VNSALLTLSWHQVDRNAPAYASGISWWGTPYDARFDLRTNGQVRAYGASGEIDDVSM